MSAIRKTPIFFVAFIDFYCFCAIINPFCKIAGSSNGRTTDFDSVYLGSNPGPAAKEF